MKGPLGFDQRRIERRLKDRGKLGELENRERLWLKVRWKSKGRNVGGENRGEGLLRTG